jgi:putative oxidoreductase
MTRWLDTRAGRIAIAVARLVVGGVFLFAALPKLADPDAFAVSIDNYHLVPAQVARAAGAALPALELVVALALLAGVHARGAAVISAGMLLVFAGALAHALRLDINVDCGCFGAAARAEIGWGSVARNLALTALCGVVALAPDAGWRGLFQRRAAAQQAA